MPSQTEVDLVWVNGTDLITFTWFSNTNTSTNVQVNSEEPFVVSPLAVGSGQNWAVSWIDTATGTHKNVYQIGTNMDPDALLSIFAPTTLSRVYVCVTDVTSDPYSTLEVFGVSFPVPIPPYSTSSAKAKRAIVYTHFFSMWDLSSGTPANVWYRFYWDVKYGRPGKSDFWETNDGLVVALYGDAGYFIDSSGGETTDSCGGSTFLVQKIDWSSVTSVWYAQYGSASGQMDSEGLSLHPTQYWLGGFESGSVSSIDNNCDLDNGGASLETGGSPSPGNNNNYFSLFAFSWDLSTSPTLRWAKTISASADEASNILPWTENHRNAWSASDLLVQGCHRSRTGVPQQGLVWPTADGGTTFDLSGPLVAGESNVYVWARSLAGSTIWSHHYPVDKSGKLHKILGKAGCPNIALLINQDGGASSLDYSFGANSATGTYSTSLDSYILVVLEASTGAFVNLISIGNAASTPKSTGIVNSNCEFVVSALLTDFTTGTCTYSSNPAYKVIMKLDQFGNMLSVSPPECYPTPSLSVSLSSTPLLSTLAETTTSPTTEVPSTIPSTAASAVNSIVNSNTPPPEAPTKSHTPGEIPFVPADEFDSRANIVESKTTIDRKSFGSGVSIPLIATSKKHENNRKYSYGTVTIPSKLIPVGWTVKISSVEEDDLAKPVPTEGSSSECDKSPKEDAGSGMVSIAFDMVILDENGKERSLQQLLKLIKGKGKGIGIQFVYSLTAKQKKILQKSQNAELRYAYLDNGDSEWSFLDDSTKTNNEGESFGKVFARVNHLTSFVVLLALNQDNNGDNECSSDVIWIVSVSLVAGAFALSILVGLASNRISVFQNLVYGYDVNGASSLANIEQALKTRADSVKNQAAFHQ